MIGNMYPIADREIREYIKRVLEGLTAEQVYDCLERDYSYTKIIKDKIKELSTSHSETIFNNWLVTEKIVTQAKYALQEFISPSAVGPTISKSLYLSEKKANGFEEHVINEIANLPNIRFWHKNFDQGKDCFRINGFINHYPDYIIKTESGSIIILETKGDYLDNTDSVRKLRLGEAWARKAGREFLYFMVFDKTPIDGAYKLADALQLIRDI
jgi:type III restriction enzyme